MGAYGIKRAKVPVYLQAASPTRQSVPCTFSLSLALSLCLPFNVSEFWLYAAFSNQPWMKSRAPWHGRRTDCAQSVSLISAVPALPGMQLMRSVALICSGQDGHAPSVWCPGGISSSPVMPFLYRFSVCCTISGTILWWYVWKYRIDAFKCAQANHD